MKTCGRLQVESIDIVRREVQSSQLLQGWGNPNPFDGGNHECHCQRDYSPRVRRFRTHRYRCGRTHRSTNAVAKVVVAEFDLIADNDGFDRSAEGRGCDLGLVDSTAFGDVEPI
jgi:hypothetical protein